MHLWMPAALEAVIFYIPALPVSLSSIKKNPKKQNKIISYMNSVVR